MNNKFNSLVGVVFSLVLLASMPAVASKSKHKHDAKPVQISKSGLYGSAITVEKSESLTQVVARYDEAKNQEVCIEGEVKKVCSNSGCWMQVSSGDMAMRVTFKDYGFSVPGALLDKKVKNAGPLVAQENQNGQKIQNHS